MTLARKVLGCGWGGGWDKQAREKGYVWCLLWEEREVIEVAMLRKVRRIQGRDYGCLVKGPRERIQWE